MRKRLRIYIVMDTNAHYTRAIFRGVNEYFSEHPEEFDLTFVVSEKLMDRQRPPKGIIAIASGKRAIKTILSFGVPAVNVSSALEFTGLPTVVGNHKLGAEMVADHFLENKLRHFSFYGREGIHSYNIQCRYFTQTVEKAGFQCQPYFHFLKNSRDELNASQQRTLRQWILNLSKPVGLFCGSDRDAWEARNAAEILDLEIGREIAIVGYGNDEMYCLSRSPRLSSLEARADCIGYEAAALLAKLIHGKKAPVKPILISPSGVVQRASSDVLSTSDPHVTMAIQFIREHLDASLHIQEVFDHVPLSRRTLERRFHESLDRTVMETIHLLKLDRIKHLLVTTSMSIEEVSYACGFSSSAYMTAFFRDKLGTVPSEYRNRFQGSKPFSAS
ncbi:MAG: substrate-binding domain-containing protein [Chthoniobacterales bacterium]